MARRLRGIAILIGAILLVTLLVDFAGAMRQAFIHLAMAGFLLGTAALDAIAHRVGAVRIDPEQGPVMPDVIVAAYWIVFGMFAVFATLRLVDAPWVAWFYFQMLVLLIFALQALLCLWLLIVHERRFSSRGD